MNKAHLELLEKNYAEACEEYLKAFCDKYEFQYEKDAWVGGDYGGVAMIADYFISLEDMRYMLLHNISFSEYLANLDYNLEVIELGLNEINLRSWCNGAPRLSREKLDKLISMRNDVEDVVKEYKQEY